jgi:hypothetical protein
MKSYLVKYRLRNGVRGMLTVLARSTCEALITVTDMFDEQLQMCSGRPA